MKFGVYFLLLCLLTGIDFAFSATVKELSIPSKFMNQPMNVSVVLPDSYGDDQVKTGKRYPVLYMLHGYGDTYASWITASPIKELADQYDMIVVCPSGLKTWYFDSFTNPAVKMESHIVKEVVPFIDKSLRTVPNRKARAISGNSMGGHGALYLGGKYPNLFGAIGALSGGVDLTPFPQNWDIKENLGEYEANKNRWKTHTVLFQLPKTRKGAQSIIISCGTSDIFYPVNKSLHDALTAAGIEHTFLESDGNHNWDYWAQAIRIQSEFFSNFFKGVKPEEAKKASK